MEIKKENLEKSKIKLTIKVSSPEMRGFFSLAYNKLAPSVEVKGFRKGAAPRALTISAIGENRLNSEILDLALKETYSTALKKENILPVAQPKVNIKVLKDLTVDTAELEYELEVDVLPEVKIGDYKKIKIKEKPDKEIKVTDEEVDQVLSHLLRQKATFTDIDSPLKIGDRAEINFSGFEKGVQIENLSSQHYPVILGSGTIIPDFEKKLTGLKKGDKKEFMVELADPKDPKNLKKPIDFKVEILETQEVILPKLDDAFAKDFQKNSLEDLKKAISEDIILQKKEVQRKNLENHVLEELLKITTIEIPESLIEQENDRQINDIRSKVAPMGMTFEKYLENLKKSEAEFRQELIPQSERMIKIGLALGEIVKAEEIDSKDKDAGKIALDKLLKYAKIND
ncbi:MAG: Trigger factor [Berkelbacteria bacterium GW2011_GWA1_36_9]|uniref:Trigger factor n=1 Tax=Berkelbacteria bacterium GW2011_GWA1_36_9 TaxID=1618331 RepID=A0A0G0FJE9_9BACT|nr:MAG: Trigger factor [Berkelbacteria bacterium GW2011_GWA1_36_9]